MKLADAGQVVGRRRGDLHLDRRPVPAVVAERAADDRVADGVGPRGRDDRERTGQGDGGGESHVRFRAVSVNIVPVPAAAAAASSAAAARTSLESSRGRPGSAPSSGWRSTSVGRRSMIGAALGRRDGPARACGASASPASSDDRLLHDQSGAGPRRSAVSPRGARERCARRALDRARVPRSPAADRARASPPRRSGRKEAHDRDQRKHAPQVHARRMWVAHCDLPPGSLCPSFASVVPARFTGNGWEGRRRPSPPRQSVTLPDSHPESSERRSRRRRASPPRSTGRASRRCRGSRRRCRTRRSTATPEGRPRTPVQAGPYRPTDLPPESEAVRSRTGLPAML